MATSLLCEAADSGGLCAPSSRSARGASSARVTPLRNSSTGRPLPADAGVACALRHCGHFESVPSLPQRDTDLLRGRPLAFPHPTCLPAPHRSQRPPLRAPSGWARQPRGSSARKTRHTCGPLGAAAPLRAPRGEGAPLRAARWGRPQFLSAVRPDVSKLYLVRTCRAEGLSTPLGSVLHLHAEVWRPAAGGAAGRDPRVCRERPRVAAPRAGSDPPAGRSSRRAW